MKNRGQCLHALAASPVNIRLEVLIKQAKTRSVSPAGILSCPDIADLAVTESAKFSKHFWMASHFCQKKSLAHLDLSCSTVPRTFSKVFGIETGDSSECPSQFYSNLFGNGIHVMRRVGRD